MTFIRNSVIVKDSERNAAKRLKSCMLSVRGCFYQSVGSSENDIRSNKQLLASCLQRKIATNLWGQCCFACKQARVYTVASHHLGHLVVQLVIKSKPLKA